MNPEINRRKTAMVLHELEIALGNYVVNREVGVDNMPNQLIEDIAKRELLRNRNIDVKSVQALIEATYLDEIFQIAIQITADTSSHKYVKRLKDLFQVYDIYEIRNVISHPNRKFIDSYWYRIACIASDPIIDLLGVDEVKKALIAAENNEIIDPPDEWLKSMVWRIPNNIPDDLEHAITGLVGRQNEAQQLLTALTNPRSNTIAIVAPGGLGKTALALDLIAAQMSLPETKEWCDACLFVSMKTERLTSTGLKKLNAAETMKEIKDFLVIEAANIFDKKIDSFDDLIKQYANEKILLFIDNLETLLRDSPHDFEAFNLSLPPSWRVLVTSRIAINANIVSLDPLKNRSAANMARIYSSRRGGENQPHEIYERIASNCYCNPLAIRLTVDLFLSGKEMPASIDGANKEIASFSYNNLIENLSKNSVKILEALFVDEESSRLELCELLSLSKEDLALGVAELSNTSLVKRHISDASETYSLNGSVRELLLTNPRNILVRSEIQANINRRKVRALEIDAKQERQRKPWYHWDYVPTDINENLKILITEFNNSLSPNFIVKHDKHITLYKKFKDSEYLYEKDSVFQRGYACLLSSLNATEDAVNHYNLAISLDEKNPANKLFLGVFYHNNSDFDNAIKIYDELIEDGWGEAKDDDKKLAYRVNQGYFLALLFSHKYEVILDKTKDWSKSNNFRGLLGAYRASAWKRKAEDSIYNDAETAIRCLSSAIRILDDVFRNDGYIKSACKLARNIFNEIASCLMKKEYSTHKEFTIESLTFIHKHFNNTMEYASYSDGDYAIILTEKLSKIDVLGNPFKSKGFKQSSVNVYINGIEESDITEKNLIKAKINGTPKGRNGGTNTFMFAKDENGVEYFLHYDQLMNGSWREWSSLKVTDQVALKPSMNKSSGGKKSVSVTEIHLISC